MSIFVMLVVIGMMVIKLLSTLLRCLLIDVVLVDLTIHEKYAAWTHENTKYVIDK